MSHLNPSRRRQRLLEGTVALACTGLAATGCDTWFGSEDQTSASEDPSRVVAHDDPEEDLVAEDDGARDPIVAVPQPKPEGFEHASKSSDDDDDGNGEDTDDAQKAVVFSAFEVKPSGGMFGAGTLELAVQGKLNQKIDSGTYVQVKAVCRDEGRFLADTAFLDSADYGKPVQSLEVGQDADLKGRVFSQGLDAPLSPCQFEFRLAGAGGGVSLPLGVACYDGNETRKGPCSPPIIAAAMSSPGKPLTISKLDVRKPPGFGSRGGLDVRYIVDIQRPLDGNSPISVKIACPVGDTKFVEVQSSHLQAGPFKYEPGESVTRSSSFFYNPTFGFADSPDLCDLTFSSWESGRGTFGSSEQVVLHDACWRDGKVRDGRCDASEGSPPEPAPASESSLELSNVVLDVVEPFGSKGDRFQLKLQTDATVEEPVDHFASISAQVTCKVGKTARVETAYLYGVELYHLRPGETTRMTSTAFSSNAMDRKPGSCEAEFVAGRRFSATGVDSIALGKWCLRRGIVKKC